MILDNSMISSFAYCPEKYNLQHVQHWSPPISEIPLAFGKAGHKGTEAFFPNKSKEDMFKAFRLEFEKYEGRDKLRNIAKGEELLGALVDQGRLELWKPKTIEANFVIEITPDFSYSGKIDIMGERDGILAGGDWKFSTQPWNFISTPNHQATGYILGLQTLLDPKINEFFFELIGIYASSEEGFRVKTDKQSKQKEVLSVFELRHVQRTPEQMESFVQDIARWAQLIKDCTEKEWFPWNTENCNGKYGPCPFLNACIIGGKGKKAFLEQMFEKAVWDPATGESRHETALRYIREAENKQSEEGQEEKASSHEMPFSDSIEYKP